MMSKYKLLLAETIMPDDAVAYPDYVYIVDGKFSRYNGWEPTPIGLWKEREGIAEIRRCELFARKDARLGDEVEP